MKIATICATFLIAAIFAPIASATKDNAAPVEISDYQAGLISQNCSSIKLQLQQLQRADAKSREHIGAQYHALSSNLMLNLSIRLAKNDLASAEVSAEQASFTKEHKQFKENYINYSQSFDKLMAINCKDNPQDFYARLKDTQAKRAEVDKSVERLNAIIKDHRETVKKIQSGLSK